jgi:gamma-glutamyltranspeptidase/glutathione hydrolase
VDAGVASVLAASVTELSRFGTRRRDAAADQDVRPAHHRHQRRGSRARQSHGRVLPAPPVPVQGILSAITPGVFDGLILALEKYGTKSFTQVVQPAVEYASERFLMPEEFGGMLRSYQRIIALWPDSTKFFYPAGQPTPRGEIFREPTLAQTFRELANAEKKAHGNRQARLRAVRDLFYKGDIARRIAAFSQNNGGLIAYSYLANYHAEIDEPKMGTYRGYEIYKPGFWTQGPVTIETLNLLEGYDLKDMGHNSPQYLHTLVEAVKLAFADRDAGACLPESPPRKSRHAPCAPFGIGFSRRRSERHHLRQCRGQPGQRFLRHA